MALAVFYASYSETRLVAAIAALALAMVITAILGLRQRSAAVVLAAVSVVWLIFDTSFEGPTLISVNSAHGLTVADLPAVLGLLVAAWELVRRRR